MNLVYLPRCYGQCHSPPFLFEFEAHPVCSCAEEARIPPGRGREKTCVLAPAYVTWAGPIPGFSWLGKNGTKPVRYPISAQNDVILYPKLTMNLVSCAAMRVR